MKRPSFQFYPGDWRSNSKLQRCSLEARGAWIEIICLLADSDDEGFGIIKWPLSDLIKAAKIPKNCAKELISKNVLKGSDFELTEALIYIPRSGRKLGAPVTLIPIQKGPIWFSSKMVRDEYIRKHKGGNTKFGASPNSAPNGRHGDGSSNSSSTSLISKDITVTNGHEEFVRDLTKFPSADKFGELPAIHVEAAVESVLVIKQARINAEDVGKLWGVFKKRHLTGEKFYESDGEVYRHFGNWITTQRFKPQEQPRQGVGSTGMEMEDYEAERQRIQENTDRLKKQAR